MSEPKIKVDELMSLPDEDKSVAIEVMDYSQFALRRNGFLTGSATVQENKAFLIAITQYLRCLKRKDDEPENVIEDQPELNLTSGVK